MNYYEELGILPDADEDEIRKAHRRLVRLMHPDQHRDPAVKQLAETQMRRLNSILSTLLDAERRHEYDHQLRASLTARPVVQTAWRKVPWWIGSTVGAVVLTVGAVWFWADHLGSSFNSRPPVYIAPENTAIAPENSAAKPADSPRRAAVQPERRAAAAPVGQLAAERAAKSKQDAPPTITATVVPSAPAIPKSKTFTLPVGTRTILSKSERQNAPLPSPSGVGAGPGTREELAPAGSSTPAVAMAPKPDAVYTSASIRSEALHSGTGDPAEGEWVYSPKEPERHKPGFYPPAFISLKLSKNDRGLAGLYKARYEVTDNKPISPDVSFHLTAVDKASRKFVWEASNGSRGTLAIRSVDGRTMRLEWRTTVFTGRPALTSGIATLERREP
jgi:curved DNA-binding protein CbpA